MPQVAEHDALRVISMELKYSMLDHVIATIISPIFLMHNSSYQNQDRGVLTCNAALRSGL
jgi:hypothetical protein